MTCPMSQGETQHYHHWRWNGLCSWSQDWLQPNNGKPREMHSLWSWDSTLARHDTTWHSRRTRRWWIVTNSIKQHLQTDHWLKSWTWSLWISSNQNILRLCVNKNPLNNSITIKMQQKSCCDTYFSGANPKSHSCCNRFSFEKMKK